jgi:ThiF family
MRDTSSLEHCPLQFVDEALTRNGSLLTGFEQSSLAAARLLIAGCGSVGGAALEPLVRLGVGSLRLADPDSYDITNINRQLCLLADVGRNKAEVLAERAEAINPFVSVEAVPSGLTEENLESVLSDVNVVFDAVDVSGPGLWIKYLLHQRAASQRVPVVCGLDIGGKPMVFVFDYRTSDQPFYGRADPESFRQENTVAAMRSWSSFRTVPADFLPIIQEVITNGGNWPQVSYSVVGIGALVPRAVLHVLTTRPIRYQLAVDIHMAARRRRDRWLSTAGWPLQTARVLRSIKAPRREPLQTVGEAGEASSSAILTPPIQTLLRAISRTPSPGNTQPWRLGLLGQEETGAERLRVGLDESRLLQGPSGGTAGALLSLGCLIEAATSVADIDYELAGSSAVTLEVGSLVREGYVRAAGAVAARHTDRRPYRPDPVPTALISSLAAACEQRGVSLMALDPAKLGRLSELVGAAYGEIGHDERAIGSALGWLRGGSGAEAQRSTDGISTRALGCGALERGGLAVLRANSPIASAATRLGIVSAALARRAKTLSSGGTLVLLSGPLGTTPQRIESGRGLMALWLEATRRGLAVQPLVDVLHTQAESPLLDLFAAGHSDPAVALVRLGYPIGPVQLSPRRPLDAVMTI